MNDLRPDLDTATTDDARQLIRMALREDLDGRFDCTSQATIPVAAVGSARFVSRQRGIVCGLALLPLIVEEFGGDLDLTLHSSDGNPSHPGESLATIAGAAREILVLERTCLNFLGRLSGVATLTRSFVDQIKGTRARILDTRKTTPGWRRLEKYAVAAGGGLNHRIGLYDAILIKDNHIAMCGSLKNENQRSISEILSIAHQWKQEHLEDLPHGDQTIVQIEVDSLDQLAEALEGPVDMVLLDNMNPRQLSEAVALRNERSPQVLLEASGGVNIDTVRGIAETGVDRISIGALTHSAVNFDIGLDWS